MVRGVRAPGAPGVGRVHAGWGDVGVTEGTGTDLRDDAGVQVGQSEQCLLDVVPVGSGVQAYGAVGKGRGERAQRAFGLGLRQDGRLGKRRVREPQGASRTLP